MSRSLQSPPYFPACSLLENIQASARHSAEDESEPAGREASDLESEHAKTRADRKATPPGADTLCILGADMQMELRQICVSDRTKYSGKTGARMSTKEAEKKKKKVLQVKTDRKVHIQTTIYSIINSPVGQ